MTLPSKTRRERRRQLMRTKLITARLLGVPYLDQFSRNTPRKRDLTNIQALINDYSPRKPT